MKWWWLSGFPDLASLRREFFSLQRLLLSGGYSFQLKPILPIQEYRGVCFCLFVALDCASYDHLGQSLDGTGLTVASRSTVPANDPIGQGGGDG